jgi:D-glycero-D-manno-heptose 1,7-bisphosphate phosphatase
MNFQRPALFLDRDGVINVDYGYVHQEKDFHFIPGVFELVRTANNLNFHVVVITNQAGIARGYYSQSTFSRLTQWMLERFGEVGACIDAVYHCPHHPTEGLGLNKLDCFCRKPHPGLLLQAIADLDIVASHSILIGDKPSDLIAGQNAGVPHLFLLTHQHLPGQRSDLPDSAVAIRHLYDPALLHLLNALRSSRILS